MRYAINLIILLLGLTTWLWPATALGKGETFTVIIDPGHGGGDTGTPHRRQSRDEKTVVLDVALRLGKLIQQNHPDVRVVYTRRTDVYPSLPERTQIAKREKGDIFISIHVNAAPDSKARGFETYVFGVSGTSATASEKQRMQERIVEERENLDINGRMVNFDTDIDIDTKILCQAQREKHNKQSNDLARDMHNALIAGLRKSSYAANVNNRGIRPHNLFVLCYSPMPAILVELGYMSNATEERFLSSNEGAACFAQGLYNGFVRYKSDWDKRQLRPSGSGETPSAPEPVAETPAPTPAAPENQESPTVPVSPAEPESPETTVNPVSPAVPQPAVPAAKATWRVQFLTADRQLKQGAPELKGLWPVYTYRHRGLIKYTYGEAATQNAILPVLRQVKKKFPDAFAVQFDAEGNRIK